MIDVIYPRLFLELMPNEIRQSIPELKSWHPGTDNDETLCSSYGKLIGRVYRHNPHSNIGLEFGKLLQPQTLCDVSQVVASSNDIDSAFRFIEQAFHIHSASYYPTVLRDRGIFSLALIFPFKARVSNFQRRFCVETVFSYAMNMLLTTADPKFRPSRISFDFPKPTYANEYRRIFGDNIRFDAPLNLIEFDELDLKKKISTGNPTLNNMYVKKSVADWRSKRPQTNFEQEAITCMLQNHPESFSCQTLASLMNLSVRGLQKKLKKHEVTFSQIANRTKKELAKIYLIQEKQSLDWTADKLGFQSRSGFNCFFKSEFKDTPVNFINLTK